MMSIERAFKFSFLVFAYLFLLNIIHSIFNIELSILEIFLSAFVLGAIALYGYTSEADLNLGTAILSILVFAFIKYIMNILFSLNLIDPNNLPIFFAQFIILFLKDIFPYLVLFGGILHSVEYPLEQQQVQGEVIKIG